ncbi:(deoxy)nucleoside triphosphate pyrophosphohydrolase [Robiginitalea marina]|uniref:8-oxo-dGTP diphosphatase n=1 Tax=Robiginitalea marina TaxID=2954105 RepID=A0ABT1B102_9FLAO|nr:(deoxy)nucleoside triphosphate pyrophosphohydrolase [Robiginitalea marina]MCO5725525.1 (deoxy)nucleoside triphosphate pyrophosphohydrolase [Robiginitalea marina]
MDTIKVVCGIIYQDGKVFICRRRPGKHLEGYWEFPGGKVESNEDEKDSLSRELHEELEMEVEIKDYYATSNYSYESISIKLIAYHCELIQYSSKLTDHDKFEWVSPEDLLDWKLAPADIPLAKKLLNI